MPETVLGTEDIVIKKKKKQEMYQPVQSKPLKTNKAKRNKYCNKNVMHRAMGR